MPKLMSIEYVDQFPLYDITVEDDHCFELHNGILAHNSMFPKDVVSGGCVAKDTKIIMSDGSVRNIQDIIVGDLVNTLDGPRTVTHTWTPDTLEEGNPERYEVVFDDGYKATVSDKHKFLTKDGWKTINEITSADVLVSVP